MQEGTHLEFKSTFTRTFLKTVSAYANYGDGEILFGVTDDGSIVGVDEPAALCLRIENSINDALKPLPSYSLTPEKRQGKEIVRLRVMQGVDTPYRTSGKAYKRSHTSTVEVDAHELNRLVLKGLNMSFEESPAKDQALSFAILGRALSKKLDLDKVDDRVYRTLGLYSSAHGFNNAAAVLADTNAFPGIDMVRFGKSINEIMERQTMNHASALALYDEAISMFEAHYKYENVSGFIREEEYLIPRVAYREAIANALVHREWDVNGAIRVSLHEDRIEVSSPGGLPVDVSEEDYLAGRLSVLRNPIIADVFAKLGYIERFGTGIPRIKASYEGTGLSPRFDITSNSITVILPSITAMEKLSDAERFVLNFLASHGSSTRLDIEKSLKANKSKVNRILNELKDKKLVEIEGSGRSTRYKI